MRIEPGGRARVKQRVHIDLAHVAGAGVAITLSGEIISGAGIVRRLCSERGGGHDVSSGRAHSGHGQQ